MIASLREEGLCRGIAIDRSDRLAQSHRVLIQLRCDGREVGGPVIVFLHRDDREVGVLRQQSLERHVEIGCRRGRVTREAVRNCSEIANSADESPRIGGPQPVAWSALIGTRPLVRTTEGEAELDHWRGDDRPTDEVISQHFFGSARLIQCRRGRVYRRREAVFDATS